MYPFEKTPIQVIDEVTKLVDEGTMREDTALIIMSMMGIAARLDRILSNVENISDQSDSIYRRLAN